MARKPQPSQVPGATPPPTDPTFEQLQAAKIIDIAKVESGLVIADQADLDALDDEVRTKLFGYYARFKAAPPDPTAKELQEGADQVLDVAIALAKGTGPLAPESEIDPTTLDRPVLTRDGWVCPAPKKA